MKSIMKSKWLQVALMVLVLILAAVASPASALMPGLRDDTDSTSLSVDTFTIDKTEYESLKRFDRMDDIISLMETHYAGDVDVDGMMEYAKYNIFVPLGDDYTRYYSAEDMGEQNEKLEGQYAGIGLQLIGDMREGTITVTRVFKDSPAERAGILRGDVIIAVNGESHDAQTMNDAVAVMRGEPGTDVSVTVERQISEDKPKETLTFTLPREVVTMNSATYKIVEGDIGYVLLYDFMGTDVENFFEAINYFAQEGAKGLIIDLRDNRGGLVNDATVIADALMPEGLIVYTENRFGSRSEITSDADMLGWPVVLLVNEYSASASEILAGALQDSGMATIVGTTTFGKGIMQQMISIGDKGEGMQYTIARYFTPNGRSIHGIGIEPDVAIEQPEEVKVLGTDAPEEDDVQLQKAIEVMREKMAEGA